MPTHYRALQVQELHEDHFERRLVTLPLADLPDHAVLVRVHYAALNYKDALSAAGNKGVTRSYPHTPGIDAAGTVEASRHPDVLPGQQVIVTSYDLGMNTPGGFGEYIRVPAGWVVPLPDGLTLREAMTLGTAGLTAALALHQMERMGQTPALGPVLVTGASGGLGSTAVALLARAGYTVVATTGKADLAPYLTALGAARVEPRAFADDPTRKPLLGGQWAGAIDTVGGTTLATALRGCRPHGNVAVCGLAGASTFMATVFPFIMRGVNMLGIESAGCPMPLRRALWNKLAGPWRPTSLALIERPIRLEDLDEQIDLMLAGKSHGRPVADLRAEPPAA